MARRMESRVARRAPLPLLCALLVLLGATPVGAADSSPAPTAPPRAAAPAPAPLTFAIADDAAQRAFPSELTSAHDVGIGAARAYVSWAGIAASRPAKPRDPADPAYRWSQTDADVARYGAAGLAVWIAFWQTPAWASGSSDTAVWPADPADLEDFAFAVARRYPQVSVFMDWNEPNLKLYARPNTITAYEPMARAIYAGVKAAHPAAEVIAGNLGRYRDNGRDPAAWAAALRADGVPMDAFGIHPYPDVSKPLAARSPRMRIDLFDVPALARLAGVPVAVTEFGWSSRQAGLANQAAFTAQAIDVARCTPGLSQFVFWGYHDHPVPDGQVPDPWVTFGWLDAGGSEKPVYASAAAALSGDPGCATIARTAGAPAGWPDTNTIAPADTSAPTCTDVALGAVSGDSVSADLACVDADGDPLSYSMTSPPAGGTVSQAGSIFTYVPAPGFTGTETFTATAGDGFFTTPITATVSVAAPASTAADAAPAGAAAVVPAPAVSAPAVVPPVTVAQTPSASPPRILGRGSVRGGMLSLAVACVDATAGCSGRIGLSALLHGSRRSLGSARVAIAPGASRTLALAIPRSVRKVLRLVAGRTISVRVRSSVASTSETSTVRMHVPRH
jgi:hypothetical protein